MYCLVVSQTLCSSLYRDPSSSQRCTVWLSLNPHVHHYTDFHTPALYCLVVSHITSSLLYQLPSSSIVLSGCLSSPMFIVIPSSTLQRCVVWLSLKPQVHHYTDSLPPALRCLVVSRTTYSSLCRLPPSNSELSGCLSSPMFIIIPRTTF